MIFPTPITHRLMMVIHEIKAKIVVEAINISELFLAALKDTKPRIMIEKKIHKLIFFVPNSCFIIKFLYLVSETYEIHLQVEIFQ